MGLSSQICISFFRFVTMGSVKEAENAIRMFNGFNLERFSLRVKVALTEEEKKQKQQQKKVGPIPQV